MAVTREHIRRASADSWMLRMQKAEQNGPTESPGLDDFAHMGLINDLLE